MLANTTRALTEAQREQWAVDGYLQLEGALSPAEVDFFSDRLLGDLGHDFRPGDFFYAPEDQASLMTGTA